MFEVARGALSKMATQLDAPVQYAFRLGDEQIAVNPVSYTHLTLPTIYSV